MDSKIKGIAMILFGILMGVVDQGLNATMFAHTSDFPFSIVGAICGIVGLVMIFRPNIKSDSSTKE